MRNESGMTIVEVIIAVLIVTVGLLAAAGTMGTVTRMLNRGEMTTTAASHAQDQFETLRALPCSQMQNGTSVRGPFQLGWTVQPAPVGNANRIVLTTTYSMARTTRVDSFETAIACF